MTLYPCWLVRVRLCVVEAELVRLVVGSIAPPLRSVRPKPVSPGGGGCFRSADRVAERSKSVKCWAWQTPARLTTSLHRFGHLSDSVCTITSGMVGGLSRAASYKAHDLTGVDAGL